MKKIKPELYFIFQATDAQTIRNICTKYIYEKCPAIAAVGKKKITV